MSMKYAGPIFWSWNCQLGFSIVTLYNVCAVPWGVLSTVGGVQYRGGYHEHRGGYLEYRGGVQYCGGYHGKCGGIS